MAGRALVLGGGGVTGVAWELGLLAGLVEEGVDITHPDVLVGTSANGRTFDFNFLDGFLLLVLRHGLGGGEDGCCCECQADHCCKKGK